MSVRKSTCEVLSCTLSWLSPVAAVAQIVTILLTWPLWQHRISPPNVPVAEGLAGLDFGLVLVATAALSLVAPRVATPAFVVALLASFAADQIRLQPEVVSLALLMVLPLFGERGLQLCRWHLTSVWLWSGLNKVLSTGWADGAASFIADGLGSDALRPVVAIVLPAAELTLGLSSLWRRTWVITRWGAVALHVGILLTLSPVFADWNSAVWPWNVALAAAGFLLFRSARASISPSAVVRMAAAVLVLHPVLFYVGASDAYLTHNLYTSNTATGVVCQPDGRCSGALFDTWDELNVPLPPEPRLYRRIFVGSCAAGTRLVVTGRATVFDDPPDERVMTCPP